MIYVDLWSKTMLFRQFIDYTDEVYEESFPVGIGKQETSTPPGIFMVTRKIISPESYYSIESGMEGKYGDCALELNIFGKDKDGTLRPYSIHGTDKDSNMKKKHTRGCISMLDDDIHFLFNHIEKGQSIVIWFGDKDEVQMKDIPNWRQIKRWPPPENSASYRRNKPLLEISKDQML